MIKKFNQFLIEDSPAFTPLTPYPGWPGRYVPPYRSEPPLEPTEFPRYREKPWPPWSNPDYYPWPEVPLPPPLLVNPRFIVPRPTQKPPISPPPLISEPNRFDRWYGTPISRPPNYNPFVERDPRVPDPTIPPIPPYKPVPGGPGRKNLPPAPPPPTPVDEEPEEVNPFGPFDDVDDGSSQENTQNPNY